ncbi:MAG: hypothetical protein C0505_13585 [Leptothrix sp. (in: Bacteria)]|nr:hypothetical protein [Leptothrix sp. (in: b-proteobacteria)]
MRIVERNVYFGPSLYAHFPVIRLVLDLGALAAWPIGRLGPAFIDALVAALPDLHDHGCSYGEPGGFIRRTRGDDIDPAGTWLGHVLEHVAIELQNIAGEAVTFGKTRSIDGRPGVYTVVYEYEQRDEGIEAGELALRPLCSLLPADIRPAGTVPDEWHWAGARDAFIRFAQRRALGPSTASLVKAAIDRDIPWLLLNAQSLIQLGHGKYQQRIQATVIGRTSYIAEELAQDKEETNKILANQGLPVPRQELGRAAERAARAADRQGYPVVTKPYNGNHGRGISIGLKTTDEVRAGFDAAAEHSASVIAESYQTAGGGICETNAAPGFRMHVAPSEGTPRDAAGPVIDMLFPSGSTSRMLAHIAKMAGFTPGLTTTDGVYIDSQRTVEGDMTGPVATRMVLADPKIDIAVIDVARVGLLRAGMGVPFVDVGAVLNVKSDHLGMKGIDTLEQQAEVKRIVVEVAKDCAVLNADDHNVIRMSAHTDAKHLCYVTLNPQHAVVREHHRAGGRACALEAGVIGQMITLYDKGRHISLMWTHLIPATLEGRAMHNVSNAMFAAALPFSLDIKLDAIRQGLRTFDTTFYQAPGRMNVYDEHPFKVIFDYAHNAHNAHAVGVMADLAGRLDVRGRRIVVVAGPGDRRDEDIRDIARAVAGRFDHYICRRDDGLRGRASDEVPNMIAAVLRALGVRDEQITLIPGEQEAIDAALRMGRFGDLLLTCADALTRSWKQVTNFKPEAAPPPLPSAAAGGPAPTLLAEPDERAESADVAAMRPLSDDGALLATGFVRDERGLRFVGEASD